MLLVVELSLVVFGLVALIRGKFTISKNKVVEGLPARLLGLVALIPWPIFFMFGFILGVMKGDKFPQFLENNKVTMIVIELVVVVLTFALVFGSARRLESHSRRKGRNKNIVMKTKRKTIARNVLVATRKRMRNAPTGDPVETRRMTDTRRNGPRSALDTMTTKTTGPGGGETIDEFRPLLYRIL